MQYVATCKHEIFLPFPSTLVYVFYSFFQCILLISPNGNFLSSFVYVIIFCVGAGITTLMSISDGSDPYFFRRKMEKTRAVKEKMDGRVIFPAKIGIFSFIINMIKVLFPICTLIWSVNNYVSHQGKV